MRKTDKRKNGIRNIVIITDHDLRLFHFFIFIGHPWYHLSVSSDGVAFGIGFMELRRNEEEEERNNKNGRIRGTRKEPRKDKQDKSK
jgi:hypothetical protein